MFFRFCKTRSRETRGESTLELFPTLPTYQNPIKINPGPLLCKVSWILDLSVFRKFLRLFFAQEAKKYEDFVNEMKDGHGKELERHLTESHKL